VVSTKTSETYAAILARHAVEPSRFLMVGNSIRSDVLPVIGIGGWTVHIPAPLSWSHEDGVVPEAARDRYFPLENLGQLPDFVDRLTAAREP
jgi:putative hydrolase of the HAD superfamily